ncbi:MAG: ATP-binding protein [Candidatus Omnitrophica bacterium]|nr:ATP-binding protein [Candidatus Omnitrophota bacterium]
MNIYAVTSLIGWTSSLFLGIFVYLRNRDRDINRTFALLSLGICVWVSGCFLESSIHSKALALICDRYLYTGAAFAPTLFLHFSLVVTENKKRKLLKVAYAFSVLFLFFNLVPQLRPFFIRDVEHIFPFRYIALPGPVWFFYLAYFLSCGLSSLCVFIKALRGDLTTYKRQQLKYMLVSMLVIYTAACMYLALVFSVASPPIDNLLVAVFSFITAYAIVRHKLMDIEIIIKKTLVFAGLLASVFTILILPTLLLQDYILRSASFTAKILGLAISGVVIILTMRRIENFLINVTDKYLFQKKYDYKELLKTFTNEVLTVLELDKLVNLTVDNLMNTIKPNSAAVLLFNSEEQQFEVKAQRNIKDPDIKLIRPDGIVTFMEETHGYLLVKELHDKKVFVPDTVQEIIDKLDAELIVPMVMHDEVIGMVSLGKKKSDDDYSQDDLDILLPLAQTLAIAIANARLFDELGKTQAEAAQKDKMAVIGTLSAGINHEICNPLGIARGQCEAFLLNIKDGLYKAKTTEELLTKAKDIMAKVIHETDRATAITKKLSQFAKPAKGESELVNVGKEIDDVLSLVGYELKLEKIEIAKKIQENLPHIFVDKKQLQEVLFNLIRNAGQAVGEKGRITISAHTERDRVFIDVQDTGVGIPEDKIKQLFNPFFTTKDPGKGTGLGLFITRQVIEKNGGRIYLKFTKIGEGTTFTLEFPVGAKEMEKEKAKK